MRRRPALGLESSGSKAGFSTGERNGSFAVKATSPVAASPRSLRSSVGSIPVEASSVASLSRNAASTRSASSVMSAFFAGRLLCAQSAASSVDIKSSISAINRSRRSADGFRRQENFGAPRSLLARGGRSARPRGWQRVVRPVGRPSRASRALRCALFGSAGSDLASASVFGAVLCAFPGSTGDGSVQGPQSPHQSTRRPSNPPPPSGSDPARRDRPLPQCPRG